MPNESNTEFTGVVTLAKQNGTVLTLDTNQKYVDKNLKFEINAPDAVVSASSASADVNIDSTDDGQAGGINISGSIGAKTTTEPSSGYYIRLNASGSVDASVTSGGWVTTGQTITGSGSSTKFFPIDAGSVTTSGGELSNTSNYSGTPTVDISIDSQTTSGVTITNTTQSSGYYIKLTGESSPLSGTTTVTRAPVTDVRTAGYIPARSSTTVIYSDTSSPTVTVNKGSKTKYLVIPSGSLSASISSNSDGGASMAATGFTPSNSATSYYVTLSTTPGSVKAKADVATGGYVSNQTNESSAVNVGVGGNGTKVYIPAGSTTQNAPTVDTSTGVVTATSTVTTGYQSGDTKSNTLYLPTVNSSTVSPTETEQTAVPANKYTLGAVKVGAISSTYVGSDIPQNDSEDLSVSGATVTAPAGYYAEDATATVTSGSAITPATSITANPTITVDSGGLITATVSGSKSVTPTVSAGYVTSGTAGTVSVSGSKTSQLTVQAAQTITPGTTDQTIASGKYLTGTQTIKGDTDLTAANIKKGVEIFGVTGTFTTTPSGKTALTAAALRSGYAGFINGSQVNGSMADTSVTEGTTTVSSSTATRGTWSQTAGYTVARTIPAATFANEATADTTYVDISSTTSAPVLVAGDYLYINKGYTDNLKISLARLVPDGSDVKGHGEYILSGHSAYDNDGTLVAGSIATMQASDISVSGATVTLPTGKYTGGTAITKTIDSGSVTTSFTGDGMSTYFSAGTSSDKNVTITPKYTNTAGYVAAHSTATNNGGTAYYKIKTATASVSGDTVSYGTGWITEGSKTVAAGSVTPAVNSHSVSTTPVVTGAISGTVTNIGTTTKPSGTDGTNYWTITPGGSVTTTGKSTANAKATVSAGYIATSPANSGNSVIDITPTVSNGTARYLVKASTSTSNGTATATAGTASTSVTGMVTTTTNTGYSVSASATGGNASVTASSATVGVGYNPSTVTASTTAKSATGDSASQTKYIQKGVLSASVSSNSGGSASMAATGFTAASSATSYYVTLSTSAGSVKAKASVGTEGYVKTETNETAATSVAVSGNGNKLYIPAGAYSGSVSSHSITTTPVVTGSISGTVTNIGTTTKPSSGTDGTNYWTITPSGSVTTTGVSTAKGKATVGTAGYVPTGNNESSASTVNITPTVSNGTARYILKGAVTNNTSGGTSSGTINRGSQIKIGAGYYPSDLYYTAQSNSGTLTINTTKDANANISCSGYANVNVTGINIPTPSSGTSTFSVKVPNGSSTVTFTFNVDSTGNVTITES